MSKTDDTWCPAFPFHFIDQSESEFDGEQFADMGMSLRDYFAAKAIAQVLRDGVPGRDFDYHFAAEQAYRMTDAMLAEREK